MLRPTNALAFFSCFLTFLLLLLHGTSLSQEGLILLQIRKGDWRDTHALNDWNEFHSSPCAWTGISCDAFNSVTTVDLMGASISGSLTSAICGLSNLSTLNLQDNAFSGPFPQGLLHCKRLRKLDLSSNQLSGTLPSRISELTELRVLNLADNAFSGSIPPAFGKLPQLEALLLHENRLNGPFPKFVGDLEFLVDFTIGSNPLRPGVVPTELGNLKQLQQLWLHNCSLLGGIPTFLGNLTQLEELDLSRNHLSGAIPTSLMVLPNLRVLYLYTNHLSGQVPANIDHLRSLSILDLSNNQLHGTIPRRIGNLTYLQTLSLCSNRLTGEIPAQLGKHRYLRSFMLNNNELIGWLPQSLGANSNLHLVQVMENKLEGPLPKNLCMRGALFNLDASSNNFNGTLPSSLEDCTSLEYLHIENNQLSGEIPPGLWGSSNLVQLFLSNNKFEGEVSDEIGEAKNLRRLNISNNWFEGRLPPQVGRLTKLEEFGASKNRLSGPIPHELAALSLVSSLQLDHNLLSGEIPTEIMSLKKLKRLNLGHNQLTGEIPAPLNDMIDLDLSNNLLCGRIPPGLGRLELTVFNVSNNDLSGRVPNSLDKPAYKESFLGNPKLCGGRNLMLPACFSHHKLSPRMLATILVPSFVILVLALCFICLYRSFFRNPLWKLTEADKLYIVQNLKESNVIGSGSGGKIYKVVLQKGQAVVVKEVRNMSEDEPQLGLIRHKNILNHLCCISREDSYIKLLVYEFLPNGSLFDRLHEGPGLQWRMRYQIALGAARGLSYMHHDCSPPILHRDLKSSNILLDGDFGAKIADSGVSRVLDRLEDESTVSGYVGTAGYMAPENVEGSPVNEKSDVYSFGVVVLELVSGRKATGEAEYEEGINIVGWIRTTISKGRDRQVLDERAVEENCEEQMRRVLRVGLDCTKGEPNQRPCMREVVEMLVACGGDNDEGTRDRTTLENRERNSVSVGAARNGSTATNVSEREEEEIKNALENLFKLAVLLVPITIALFVFTVPIAFKNHGKAQGIATKDKTIAIDMFLVGDIVGFVASIIVAVILAIRRSVGTHILVLFSKLVLCTAVAFFLLSFLAAFYLVIPSVQKWIAISVALGILVVLCCACLYIISK